jgi:hypothetical protein
VWLLLHRTDDPEAETATLRLYLDESGGLDPNTPHAVVGGLLITRRGFLPFEDAWDQMLESHGIVAPLHMKEFNKYGRFGSMSDCCRRELMLEVVSLIETYKLRSLSVSLSNEEFAKHIPAIFREHFGVYGMCFLLAALGTHRMATTNDYQERIPFILDSGNPCADHVRGAHASMIDMQKQGNFLHVGGLLFEDDTDFGTLQASDVIAWAARRRATLGSVQYPFDPLNKIFDDTIRHIEASWRIEWLLETGERLMKGLAEMKAKVANAQEAT